MIPQAARDLLTERTRQVKEPFPVAEEVLRVRYVLGAKGMMKSSRNSLWLHAEEELSAEQQPKQVQLAACVYVSESHAGIEAG